MDEPTRGDRLRAGGDLVLGVEGVAQRGPREAALPQRLFGVPVIGGDDGRVLLHRIEVGRVGHVTHACLPGSLDGGAVLGHAAADNVGADQQQPLPARERLGEGLRPIKVGLPDLRPAPGEVGERLGAPRGEGDLGGRHASQHEFGGQTTELAGCSGDDYAYEVHLS